MRWRKGLIAASRVAEVCSAHTEAAATAVEPTAATAEPEVSRPRASTRERTVVGCGASEGRVPASGSSPPWARRWRSTSPTVVTTAAAAPTAMSAVPARVVPGARRRTSGPVTKGATRLPMPMLRLAIVSLSS